MVMNVIFVETVSLNVVYERQHNEFDHYSDTFFYVMVFGITRWCCYEMKSLPIT